MTEPRSRVPAVVVRAGAGEAVTAAGVGHLFTLTGEQTGGRLGVDQMVVPPGVVGAGRHIHWSHDECFLVVAGELSVARDTDEVVLLPGDLAFAPRGSVHGFRNAGADVDARVVCLFTPPGYENYFREVHAAVAAGGELTPELLAGLRSRYDTETC